MESRAPPYVMRHDDSCRGYGIQALHCATRRVLRTKLMSQVVRPGAYRSERHGMENSATQPLSLRVVRTRQSASQLKLNASPPSKAWTSACEPSGVVENCSTVRRSPSGPMVMPKTSFSGGSKSRRRSGMRSDVSPALSRLNAPT